MQSIYGEGFHSQQAVPHNTVPALLLGPLPWLDGLAQ